MGTVTVSLPADGSTGTVSQYNTPLTTVVNEFNGNIDNNNIKSGAAIATAKLATDAGIVKGMLGTDSSYAWASWTPTLTNAIVGNGTLDCQYTQIGKTVHMRFKFTLGSTSSISGGEMQYTLPVTAVNKYGLGTGFFGIAGQGVMFDSSASAYFTIATLIYSTTIGNINSVTASGSFTQLANMAGSPVVAATSDIVFLTATYEAA